MIPSAPFAPKYAISIRTLDIFKNLRCRCPYLTVQPFIPPRASYYNHFSVAFDLYLEMLESTRKEVLRILHCDDDQWRLKNTCPACSYKLEGEDKLVFEMLITMDGNNSLKRLRRTNDSGDNPLKPCKSEWRDSRSPPGDYYISREEVNRWDRRLGGCTQRNLRFVVSAPSESPCSSQWSNMNQDARATSHTSGVFDETGIFLSLCRHGFVLLVADMVQSGELSKYPLATVNTLLNAFGSNLGIGYDIGCQFKTTVAQSQLNDLASNLNYNSLVGSFHGHAHNQLCQLSHLATYVKGLGLEDLEGCERFFSKSNALARSIRYASVFHRQQSIVLFLQHMDSLETYASLSKFLVNNYRQALDILKTEPALCSTMKAQGIFDVIIFADWLREEREYLKGLDQEPVQDTLEMEYYQQLTQMIKRLARRDIELQRATFLNSTPETLSQNQRDCTRTVETKQHQLIEKRNKVLDIIHDIEHKIGIKPEERWLPSSKAWAVAAEKVRLRNYRKCLDHLESLVVSQIFELSKANMPQTGYNLRIQIRNALRERSPAIKTALQKYNEAASSLRMDKLKWDDIVQYAILSDFDLLRCARQDIHEKAWAVPTNRLLRDRYFKIEQAREEIKRLDIEIRRVVTHIRDEERFLAEQETLLRNSHPELAHQVACYRQERGRSNDIHIRRFEKLSVSPTFSGTLNPGIAIVKPQAPQGIPSDASNKSNDTVAEDRDIGGDDRDISGDDNVLDDDEDGSDDDDSDDGEDHEPEDIAYSLMVASCDNHSEM
ncbi:hypothetical protein F5887DRAFT_1068103 [Amanita rubescens]|nr:hypothetical protein F5887DRAFT_1068103 [Amanita rubescens]